MNCFKSKRPKNNIPSPQTQEIPDQTNNVRHEILLRIPECKVHLMDEGETLELTAGNFELVRISDENVCLATTIKVGDELQWPLTKDEPVVKLDGLQYLFSLPMKDEKPMSYGVEFSEKSGADLGLLDSFLKENCLFSSSSSSSRSRTKKDHIDWKEFAPAVDEYNNVLAKAIAGGTGQIIKGIFKCSNAYTNQVQKGGETILIRAAEEQNSAASKGISHKSNSTNNQKRGAASNTLKRVRKLSRMTEKMSKAMLDVVGVASGSVMGPVVRSGAGKTFLSMVPGQVLLASLDAVKKIQKLDLGGRAVVRKGPKNNTGPFTKNQQSRETTNCLECVQDKESNQPCISCVHRSTKKCSKIQKLILYDLVFINVVLLLLFTYMLCSTITLSEKLDNTSLFDHY